MAIINRTLDPTEQKKTIQFVANATANGVTMAVYTVPWPANIIGGQLSVWGVSGAPTYAVSINRFIAGTGFTTIVVATGTSNTPAEFGTSGPGSFGSSLFGASGMIFAAVGSTLMQCQANDLIMLTSGGGSSAAVKGLSMDLVIQPTVDIKYNFGLGL